MAALQTQPQPEQARCEKTTGQVRHLLSWAFIEEFENGARDKESWRSKGMDRRARKVWMAKSKLCLQGRTDPACRGGQKRGNKAQTMPSGP